jgi:hypothetical protein
MASDFEENVARQTDAALSGRELQELRYGLELDRAGRIYRRRLVVFAQMLGAGIAAAVAMTQLPDGIAKLLKLFFGKQ